MSGLKSRIAQHSHWVVKESVQNIRILSTQLDQESSIDRVLQECALLSTSLKKLERILEDDAQQSPKEPTVLGEEVIGVDDVNFYLRMLTQGRLCKCGGFIPRASLN